jgi:putative hydrolase of the HAD superfamily
MIPGPVRAIFFDAVGTLLHPEPSAPQVYAEVGRRHGSRLTGPIIAARFRAAFQREEERDLHQDLRTSEAREMERWRCIVGEVLDDTTDRESCFHELFTHFGRSTAWRCAVQAGEVLGQLAARGYVLGLASNYDGRLRSVCAGLPPLAAVQHLVISSEIGWRKPAPAFFAALCRQVELRPEQVLLVGDDWDNDYQGASRAGLRAILLDASASEFPPEVVRIHQLSQLLSLP